MNVPEPGRQERLTERRTREIVDAATRIFNEKGYEGASIKDIAEAVGILKGSLYYYIKSKEDLLFQIIEEHHLEIFSNLDRFEQVEGSTLDKLRLAIEWHILYNAENHVRAAVFHREFKYLGPERFEKIVSERDRYAESFRALLGQAQGEGFIRPDLDIKLATLAVLGMLNSLYEWYKPEGEWDPQEVATGYADLVLRGVLGVDELSATRHAP